jgi:hypothetical protein
MKNKPLDKLIAQAESTGYIILEDNTLNDALAVSEFEADEEEFTASLDADDRWYLENAARKDIHIVRRPGR